MRAVILAAGASSRAGKQKLLVPYRGRPLIEYAIVAAARWNPVVVAGHEVALYLGGRAGVALIRNDEPELGMSHSLMLANGAIAAQETIAVLLADKPRVSEQLIEATFDASRGADITYPQREGEPGHPVVLSSRARRVIGDLPHGDSLRLLRAHPQLVSRAVGTADEGAFYDIDTIDGFEL